MTFTCSIEKYQRTMAQQPQPQYEFRYQRVQLFKTESLGIGSYGAVCKAMCDDLPCAAKILHPALFQFLAPGTTSVMRKFEQECCLLSAIKHPHIVQCLGTYHDPELRLPVLLMELMDESLTRFLERSREPLPYHTEVNICHDITLALSYLHSNGIVHRDLSSNNVLLIAGSRAKVTDFGMVKLYDVNRSTAHLTSLTQCPGTLAYMSPEALKDRPVYTDKLDSFSLGVLCVQIMTQQFPDPGDRFQVMVISDPRIPSGRVQVEVPEIERRQSHIDLIDPAHPLLPVALDCLKDSDRERPSCHELCGHMSTLKASPKYTASVQQSQMNTKPTQSANRGSREREIQQSQQIQDLQEQLHTQDDQLQALNDQLQEKEQEIEQKQQQILGLQTLLAAKDEQLNHELQQKEAAIAAHQHQIQDLQEQLHTQDDQLQALNDQLQWKEQEIEQKQQQILGLRTLLTAKDEQLNHELQQKEAAIAAHQHQTQDLQEQLHTQDDQLQALNGQLQWKEQEIEQKQQQILGLRTLLTAKDEQLNHALLQKEAAVAAHQKGNQQLRQQLQYSEQVAAEFQQNLLEREKIIQDQQSQIQELQQQLRQRGGQRREEGELSGAGGSIKLRWRDGGRAPCKMCGSVAAVDGCVAYFYPGGMRHKIFAYNSTTKTWSELPKCPNHSVSLTMVNGLLTAIGGKTSNYVLTNSLLSLTDKWTKQFPPMPTKRSLTSAVCSGRSLVVAGGVGEESNRLTTVEVMDTGTIQWSTAYSLPHSLCGELAMVCGDQVYMLGGFEQRGKYTKFTKSLFTCSLAALLQSCQPQSLGARLKTLSLANRPQVWHQLADTPVTFATWVALHGRLLAVGGKDSDDKQTTAIHMYNTTTNSWEVISHMETPRRRCLVAVLPHNELMVVGGVAPHGMTTDTTEIATIV